MDSQIAFSTRGAHDFSSEEIASRFVDQNQTSLRIADPCEVMADDEQDWEIIPAPIRPGGLMCGEEVDWVESLCGQCGEWSKLPGIYHYCPENGVSTGDCVLFCNCTFKNIFSLR